MTSEKPSHNEQEYFARQDAELIDQHRHRDAEAAAAAERRSHHMKCPKCGHDLASVSLHNVQVETCPHCHGIWLDSGELDTLMKHEDPNFGHRLLTDVLHIFRKKPSK